MAARTSLLGFRCAKDAVSYTIVSSSSRSIQVRFASSSIISKAESNGHVSATPQSAFSRLTTPSLFRAVILGSVLKRSWLFDPGLWFMERLARSESALLDVDKNPVLRGIVRPLIYKQFCAGRNRQEIQETINSIKDMGYTGVILCYAREITINKDDADSSAKVSDEAIVKNINAWRDGNLETLESVGEGDYIGIK